MMLSAPVFEQADPFSLLPPGLHFWQYAHQRLKLNAGSHPGISGEPQVCLADDVYHAPLYERIWKLLGNGF